MHKIGDFSKIAQVSMRMLRHYDEIGLFKPDYVDETTGYRYYSTQQLPQLNRIVALRMLDFNLEEIRLLLRDELNAQEIRALYKANKAKLEAQIQQEQQRLRLLETRLEQLDDSDLPEAVLKEIPERRILSLREIAPDFAAMDTLIDQIREATSQLGDVLGHSLAIFYDRQFEVTYVDWELGFVLEADAPASFRLKDGRQLQQRSLAGLELVASTLYEGSYTGLHKGYSALGSWIEANGYEICGIGRELFWHMDLQNPEQNVTEILFPVKPRA